MSTFDVKIVIIQRRNAFLIENERDIIHSQTSVMSCLTFRIYDEYFLHNLEGNI